MPRHRSLTLRKFVDSIDHQLMERYFTTKFSTYKLPVHIILDAETVEDFMQDPRNIEAKGLIKEDFSRINDICDKGKNHVVRSYRFHEIPIDGKLTPQGLAMQLFLDHPEAFDYAFAWHCYYNSSSKMSHHNIPGDFELSDKQIESFQKDTKDWFENLAKGEECQVQTYNEDGQTVILVKHGSYVQTIAHWKNDEIETISYRPAHEDLLLYDKDKGLLSIKARLDKDRQEYIRLFSKHLMQDESLADRDDLNKIYSLQPLQDGSFDWNGNEHIRQIILTKIKFVLRDSTNTVLEIKSDDVRKSLDMLGYKKLGLLISVRFRFVLDIDGKTRKVSFMIAPPDVSDLSRKKYSDIISSYLTKQGVKLV